MVVHVLKDGTIVPDITGHVVNQQDVPVLYQMIDKINSDSQIHGENRSENQK